MTNQTPSTGLKIIAMGRPGLGPIDLELAPGKITALMGPSGAGKTMLLRTIADLDPGTGDAFIGDEARADMGAASWRKRVMYVPANSGWWVDKVGPHFAGTNEEVVVNLLHALGLETTALDWDVAHLSTGEKQRLGLARALAVSAKNDGPNALLLDEPTSGLDETNRDLAEKLIAEKAASGTTVLMVTHDKSQATRMGAKVLNISQGKLHDGGVV